jgi:hypothetical protein
MTTDPKAYRAIAHILLHTPIASDDGKTMTAYYRLYLVSAPDTDAALEAILRDVAEEGILDRNDLRIDPIDPDKVDPVMRSTYPGINAKGIWYRSGKGFHG